MKPHCLLLQIVIFIALAHSGAAQTVDFETQVRPLLNQHCTSCHGPLKQASGLRLDARVFAFRDGDNGPAIVPGRSSDSTLWQRVSSHDEAVRMPPEGQPLTTDQQQILQQWIDTGAVWVETEADRAAATKDARRDHWAWQPLAAVTVPPLPRAVAGNQPANPIDGFLHQKLSDRGLTFSPAADRRTLIRRLCYDLLGLPPSPQEIRDFEADTDPQAYEHLVNRLLDSPHYGERAAQHWLDIAHYADTHGFERDQVREHAWRYRDWVIEAFNRDMPYDQFIIQQIAGDALDTNDPQSVIATGFLSAGPWDFVGQAETPSPVLRRLARADDLDDMVTQVMAATMAITINCARCHDHKLDPITQREYYSICAVFAGVKRGNRPVSAAAEQHFQDRTAALNQEISSLKQQIRALTARGWDLADVVGGGNGLGSGQPGVGIDPATGEAIKDPRGFLEGAAVNKFVVSPAGIVDGVSIPSGSSDGLVISSTGLQAANLPATSGKAWDAIRHGPVHSQYSTRLGDIEYHDGSHTMLGLHANALITFDLSELPPMADSEGTTRQAEQLHGAVGYFGQTPQAEASVYILLDGHMAFRREQFGRDDGLQAIDLEIPPGTRFLTLVATDHNLDISHDQVGFVDLVLQPAHQLKSEQSAGQAAKVAELKERLELLTGQLAALEPVQQVYAVQSETPANVSLLARGDTEQPREAVQPGAVDCVQGLDNFALPETASDFQRRAQLAQWITADDNPLLARVIVNRLWQQHFGVGIVSTPSDFGLGGSLPSHPELLDWLAGQLKQHRYSLKAIHRLICCSAAYRQQSTVDLAKPDHQQALQVDSANQLIWRQNPRRLDAEALRDAVLVVSGRWDTTMYGPGFRDFDYKEEYAPVYTYVTRPDPGLFRRSIYRFRVRTTPNPLLTTFDCPNPANLTPTRNTTTTALQSLAMLNHEFLLQQADSLAQRLEQISPEVDQQIDHVWWLALGRAPTEKELTAAASLISRHGLAAFCRYLMNANEFVTID